MTEILGRGYDERSQLDRVLSADDAAVRACLDRALHRLKAAEVLRDAELLESAFTNAYDAYRTAADALVLMLAIEFRPLAELAAKCMFVSDDE